MTAIDDVAAERKRQIEAGRFDTVHDDRHDFGELLNAAMCYIAISRRGYSMNSFLQQIVSQLWPWDREWWKPKDRRRNLVKAAALIVAEIDRLDRAATLPSGVKHSSA